MRSMLIFVWAALVLATAAAAQSLPKVDEKAVSAVVGELMKDPESLRIKNVRLMPADEPNTWHLCGQYNAKNELGGYQGFEYFVGSATRAGKGPLTYLVRDTGDFARSFCTAQ